MGMYTRLDLNVALTEADPVVLDKVRKMVNHEEVDLPDRMPRMLHSSSYYHDNIQHASLAYDDIRKCHKLSVVCDLKNYGNEIEQFLAMIAPIASSRFAGYYRYEESTVPTLVWFLDGKLVTFTPELPRELAQELDGV